MVQRTRIDVIAELARHDFARARIEVQRMNSKIVDYDLRDIEESDLADLPFLVTCDLSCAKMVKFDMYELSEDGIHRTAYTTSWIYPDTDLHLPNATLIARPH